MGEPLSSFRSTYTHFFTNRIEKKIVYDKNPTRLSTLQLKEKENFEKFSKPLEKIIY